MTRYRLVPAYLYSLISLLLRPRRDTAAPGYSSSDSAEPSPAAVPLHVLHRLSALPDLAHWLRFHSVFQTEFKHHFFGKSLRMLPEMGGSRLRVHPLIIALTRLSAYYVLFFHSRVPPPSQEHFEGRDCV